MSMESLPSERRVDVWEALADLFTGKDLQSYDYQHIADVLCRSGYSVQDLEEILQSEVTPVFRGNLGFLSVPEMEGWDRASVMQAITAHVASRLARQILPRARWQGRPPALVRERWAAVKKLIHGSTAGG
jgi:hypothetical protein